MRKYQYCKILSLIFLLNSLPVFSQNLLEVKKERTLLDFEYGMTNKELSKHISNLRTSYIIHDYRFDSQANMHEFYYDFPINNINSDNKARAKIRLDAKPYLLDIFVLVEPPIDSAFQKVSGTQRLYEAYKKQYGNPIKPLLKYKDSFGTYSEAIWKGSSYSIRWFQKEGDKIMIFYKATGEYYENLKKELDRKRGVIKVERRF